MNFNCETNADVDILRKQINFQKAGIEAGMPVTNEQSNWLKEAENHIFWWEVQFQNAKKILGRDPINQDEAQKTVRDYNSSQNALSR